MMDALTALMTRVSPARLLPDPVDDAALQQVLLAGVRAPDHGRLRPWKFLVIRGEARTRLGEVLAQALQQRDPGASEGQLRSERDKPLRAPVIVVVAAAIQPAHKIPEIEQVESAAAAAQNMLLAAHALGMGGFWRTGAPAYDNHVKAALGLKPGDEIVGLLYIGRVQTAGPAPAADVSGVVEEWRGPAASSA